MKKLSKILIFSLVAVFFVATTVKAGPVKFSFNGVYTLSDVDTDGFSENIQFGSGDVTYSQPLDALFTDIPYERVDIAVPTGVTLDPSSYVSGVSYDFNPNLYVGGFQVFDDVLAGGTHLMTADITLNQLLCEGATADINPYLLVNLTNVTAGAGYVAGSSIIIDSFLAAAHGATTITLQMGSAIGAEIEAGNTVTDTYSGCAVVPEPTTVLLLGFSLLGLVGINRKKRCKL